ncbi:MAG: hypothetical protein ACR2MG_06670 [Pyrinomonadaceae bacterium]
MNEVKTPIWKNSVAGWKAQRIPERNFPLSVALIHRSDRGCKLVTLLTVGEIKYSCSKRLKRIFRVTAEFQPGKREKSTDKRQILKADIHKSAKNTRISSLTLAQKN